MRFVFLAESYRRSSYQWRRNELNLTNGGRISGALGATLTIADVRLGDAGFFDCVVTNNAGTTTSQAARLVVNPCLAVVSDQSIPCAAVGVHAYTTGTLVNVSMPTTETAPDGLTRWLCSGWTSQGGNAFQDPGSSDVMVVLDQPTTLTLHWETQFKFSVTVNPVAGGMVTLADGTTPAEGWYNANAAIQLKAVAQPGYWFYNWGGNLDGFGSPANIQMTAPVTVSVRFSLYKNGVRDWGRYK